MVRFQWHVEDGFGAFINPGNMKFVKDAGVCHSLCEIELAGQSVYLEAILTMPSNYLQDGAIRDVGVVLAHGPQAATWKGKLLTQIAVTLAKAGHIVMRYHCGGKEQRRLRIFEKALDAAATSPFARNVTRWVLAGVGSGARVAASVGSKCRGNIAGFALLGYPMTEPVSVFKGPTAPDSTGPITKLHAPLLFVQPDKDSTCNADMVKALCPYLPSWDVRLVEVAGVDMTFRDPDTRIHPVPEIRQKLADTVLEFVSCLSFMRLDACTSLPRIKAAPPPTAVPIPSLRPPLQQPVFALVTRTAAALLPPGTANGALPALPPPVPAGFLTPYIRKYVVAASQADGNADGAAAKPQVTLELGQTGEAAGEVDAAAAASPTQPAPASADDSASAPSAKKARLDLDLSGPDDGLPQLAGPTAAAPAAAATEGAGAQEPGTQEAVAQEAGGDVAMADA